MTDHKIIRVVWQDAVSVDAWTCKSEIKPELALIVTVGLLIVENDETVTVGLSHDTTSDNFSSFINIPKSWIVCRDELKTPKRKKAQGV